MATKGSGSAKRFGPRYGRTSRGTVSAIEKIQKKAHLCPYCKKTKAKRISAGIWFCTNCSSKFTGKAFTITPEAKKKVALEEENIEVEDE